MMISINHSTINKYIKFKSGVGYVGVVGRAYKESVNNKYHLFALRMRSVKKASEFIYFFSSYSFYFFNVVKV